MAVIPGGLIPFVEQRFLKVTADGLVPNALGTLTFRETDLTTPKDTYTTQALSVANTNPITLDADGRPPHNIYLAPGGYSVFAKDSDGADLWDIPYVSDVGSTFAMSWGTTQAAGQKSISSLPYSVSAANDNYVTVDSASAGNVVLPLTTARLATAAGRNGLPIYVVNESNNSGAHVTVLPTSPDTLQNGSMGANSIVLPAVFGVTPLLPSGAGFITLGDGNWLIIAIFGLRQS